MENVNAQIQRVNKILRDGEPYNTKADYKGYIGYIAQFIKDAMNEVFGAGNWGVEELSSEIVDAVQYGATPNKQGVSFLAVSEVEVWIEGVKSRPRAYGETNVTLGSVGDARKGARTDAMKKALSDFSIGNRPYLGEFKKENQGAGNNNQGRASNGNQGGASGSQGRPAAVTPNQPARANGNQGRAATTNQPARPAVTPNQPASQKKTEAAATSSQPAPVQEETAPVSMEGIPTVKQLKQEVSNLGLDWKKVLLATYDGVIKDGRFTEERLMELWAQPVVVPAGRKKLAKYIQTLKAEHVA